MIIDREVTTDVMLNIIATATVVESSLTPFTFTGVLVPVLTIVGVGVSL